MQARRWRWDWLWVVFCGTLSSVWCVTAADQLSATFDEPLYVERGLQAWRDGSHSGLLRVGTMPLPADVQTLPLYLWECWRGAPFDPVEDFAALLPVARAGTLAFWWLLLIYGFVAARSLAGPWAGKLAVALLACEPSLLAHASLATTDIAVSACVLAFAYHFRRGREQADAGWWRRAGLPMVWFALAVLAKASGLIYCCLCMAVLELDRLARAGAFGVPAGTAWAGWLRNFWGQLRPLRRDAWWIAGGGMVLVFVYCGSDWKPQPSFVQWAHGLPEGTARQAMVWLAENLCVFSNAGEGIVRQVKHNMHGHGAYLLGRSDPHSFWYYFPVVLTLKLSLPLLLAPVVVAVLRPRALNNWACLLAAVLLVFSLTFRVQIGVRLVLPLVVLTVVGLSAALAQACQGLAGRRRRLLAGGVGAGVGWTAASALLVWPHALCYVNELWGGTRDAYRLVSETNYDWGQGLKELARWQRERGLPTLTVWYFGTDPTRRRLPMRELALHTLPLERPEDVLPRVRGQHLAVSTTLLYGTPINNSSMRQAVAFLRSRTPAARTTTFLIFDFTGEGAASAPAGAAPAGS
jgi:hypothetical protein